MDRIFLIYVLVSPALWKLVYGSGTVKQWMIGGRDKNCNQVCSEYNAAYTCDLSEQQTMTDVLCGELFYSGTEGYSNIPSGSQRGDPWPEYPAPAHIGSDDGKGTAPCSLQSKRLWYLYNKDQIPGSQWYADLTCDVGLFGHYPLCSCVTGEVSGAEPALNSFVKAATNGWYPEPECSLH